MIIQIARGEPRRVARQPGRARALLLSIPACILLVAADAAIRGGVHAAPWRLRSVTVEGGESVSRREVLALLDLRPGGEVGEGEGAAWAESVERLYRSRGYPLAAAEVRAEEDTLQGELAIRVLVQEGPRATLQRIALEGNRALGEEEFRRLSGLAVGAPFAEEGVARGLERVVDWYGDRGFPFAEVRVSRLTLGGGGEVDLGLGVREGRRVRVGHLDVEGNDETRPSVVVRQTGLREGEPLSRRALREAQARLEASGLFARVDPVTVIEGETPSRVGLRVRVVERPFNTLSAGVGMEPGPSRGGLAGSVHLRFRNLLGTARRADLSWSQGGDVTLLALGWWEPWVLGGPVGLQADYEQEVRDTTLSAVRLRGTGVHSLGPSVEATMHLGYERVAPGGARSTLVGRGERWGVGGGARLRALDHPVNPRRGGALTARVERGWSRIGGQRASDVVGEATGIAVREARERLVLAFEGGARWARGSGGLLFPTLLFPLGGATTVRGYSEGMVWGSTILWGRTELRWVLSEASRAHLLYDAGWARLPAADGGARAGERSLHGYGAGVLVGSRAGVIGIDYALRPGDGPGEGRIHLRLLEEF